MGPRVRLLSGVMFVLSWSSQQPGAALIRGPGLAHTGPSGRLQLHRTVYSTTANNPHTKEGKKEQGWGGKGRDGKQRDLMPGVLVAFHEGPPSLCSSGGKEEEGGGFRAHSSVFVPWRGVGFGCRRQNEGRSEPLQTRRPWLAWCSVGLSASGILWSAWPQGLSNHLFCVYLLSDTTSHGFTVLERRKQKQLYEKQENDKGNVDKKTHPAANWAEPTSAAGESHCQSIQGEKDRSILSIPVCRSLGFSPRLARRQEAGWHCRCNFQLCPFSKRLKE